MNNFFFKGEDYSLFRKALHETKGEPVVINLLSTDSSLIDESKQQEDAPVVRKNLSNKFQPSPFGKFFGPRKQRTTPVDMGNFSSWKNKNFREAEQNLGKEDTIDAPKFSLSDYMNKSSVEKKFNEEDQHVTDTQKSIDQLSTSDPTYQKYSLDSYLHKLEEQTKVKDKFKLNDDLLEPLGVDTQMVVPDSSQDENFSASSIVDVEDVSFDENIRGEKFAFETSELDKVRTRLDKIEREAANIKDKPTDKIISTDEFSELTGEDKFDLEKLGVSSDEEDEIEVDDIEKINEKLTLQGEDSEEDDESNKVAPKVTHKRFFEVNKNPGAAASFAKDTQGQLSDENEDISDDGESLEGLDSESIGDVGVETETNQGSGTSTTGDVVQILTTETSGGTGTVVVGETTPGDQDEFVSGTRINRDDILTKEDFKTITDEFMAKFTELYKKDSGNEGQSSEGVVSDELAPAGVNQGYTAGPQVVSGEQSFVQDPYMEGYPQQEYMHGDSYLQKQHAELQAKILEMIEQNKKTDAEAEQKLRQAEIDKQKVTEQYEARLRELEQSFKKRDEEIKKQAYLDKLKNDIKLKKAETKFKRREEEMNEMHKASSEMLKIGVVLKKELKNNLNISNLEMDKKLLEVASKIRKEELEEEREVTRNVVVEEPETVVEEPEEVVVEEKPKKTTTKKTTTRKKTTRRSHSHTRTPRRKIDSDIIGGIKFD